MVFKDRPTIAVMTSAINWWYANEIHKGIRYAADEIGVNLRFFTGRKINSPELVERERNAVYGMINKQNVDGIIVVAAALCEYLSPEEMKHYFSAYAPLPVVAIGDFAGNIPEILTDNVKGMGDLLRHLILDHGYRKIAYMSGPMSNGEAVTRLETFKKTLQEEGLEVDPAYIVYGQFKYTDSKKLIAELLDERGLKPEVLVCANDDMAFGAYHELKERGITIPGDIALTGFDDVQEALYTFPPLTTVRQPFFVQGQEALNKVLDILKERGNGGQEGKKEHYRSKIGLPARLVIRKSCGCNERTNSWKKENHAEYEGPEKSMSPQDRRSGNRDNFEFLKKIDILSSENSSENTIFYSDGMRTKIGTLYRKLIDDLENETGNMFFELFKEQVYYEGITEEDLNRWNSVLKLFRSRISVLIDDRLLFVRFRELLNGAREILEEVRYSIIGKKQIQSDILALTYQTTLERISGCLSFDELLFAVYKNFTRIDIDCFYLSFYSNNLTAFPPSALPVEESRLFIGFDGKQMVRYPGEICFPTRDLVPGRKFFYKRNNHFVIYPLTVNNFYFGIIVLEYFEEKKHLYDPLIERLCGAIGTIRHLNDIEETVKKRTGELRESNRKLETANDKLKELDAAKTNFFANISHELRTPLTLILGPLESLLAGDYGKVVTNEHTIFNAMHNNSVRLLQLINNLLDFSKIEAGKMKLNKEKTDLTKLIRFYVHSIHSGIASKGLILNFIDHTEKILIDIDRELIEKAFFNLISNAIKFSKQGGTITVSLNCDEESVFIHVEDRGIGIPPGKLKDIFDRFTQVDQTASRSYEGTGIGLAFAKEIVELHQGKLLVESEEDKGSTFTISLPRTHGRAVSETHDQPRTHGRAVSETHDQPRTHGRAVSETHDQPLTYKEAENENRDQPVTNEGEESGNNINEGKDIRELKNRLAVEFLESSDKNRSISSGEKKTGEEEPFRAPGSDRKGDYILIVDDNYSMREFIQRLLEKTYTIQTAVNGKDALKMIEKDLPDLIISDVMMPEMNGLELCVHLKNDERTAHIPLILLTARVDIGTRIAGLEQKADDYLIKPFNARELFARIENLLEKRRLEKKLKATRDALWGEMEITRKIQTSLLPDKPVLEGFQIACYLQSASEVGGDYYDVIHCGQRSWLVIGDVSGHGITAGLVMMMVQTALNLLLYKCPDISPSQLLADINRVIKDNISKLGQQKYMTIMVLALIENRRFLFSGLHQDIFIYRAAADTVQVVQSQGMWIGFIDDISHLVQNDTFEMEKGDTLLLYTDGITEAVKKGSNPDSPDKRFGNERLQNIFRKNGGKTPEQIKAAFIKELEHYICDDDFTFVIVQCEK